MLTLEARARLQERGTVVALLALGEIDDSRGGMACDGYELALIASHDDAPRPTRVWRIRFHRDGRWVRAGYSFVVRTPADHWLNLAGHLDLRRPGDA